MTQLHLWRPLSNTGSNKQDAGNSMLKENSTKSHLYGEAVQACEGLDQSK